MDQDRKQELLEPYLEDIDGPFNYWCHEDKYYHSVGMLQAWIRGYTNPKKHMFIEPPQWTTAFKNWLQEHNSKTIDRPLVGPPIVVFPDEATALAFKEEWHLKARERFPYEQRDHYMKHIAPKNEEILRRHQKKENGALTYGFTPRKEEDDGH